MWYSLHFFFFALTPALVLLPREHLHFRFLLVFLLLLFHLAGAFFFFLLAYFIFFPFFGHFRFVLFGFFCFVFLGAIRTASYSYFISFHLLLGV